MSNSHIFLKTGFLKVPLQNGVGRYVCQLQRIVLKFCKYSGSSRGIREFIENDLIHFSNTHPGVVVYVKPRRHRSPVAIGEFLNGERQWMSIHNMSHEEVARWINYMVGCQDSADVRIRKPWYTDFPSIQGPWTPFDKNYLPKSQEHEHSAAYKKLLELAKEQGINTNINLKDIN